MALYECRDCRDVTTVPRRYRYHLGDYCRCPRCGTMRIGKLKERDRIDPMESGLLHLLERLAGGSLYHCRVCRVQFYDRRLMSERAREQVAVRGAGASAR